MLQLRQTLASAQMDWKDKQEVREWLRKRDADVLQGKMKKRWQAVQDHVMSDQEHVVKLKNLIHKPKVAKQNTKAKFHRRKAIIVLNEDNETMAFKTKSFLVPTRHESVPQPKDQLEPSKNN